MLDPESPVRVAGVARIEEADMVRAYERVPALQNRQALWTAGVFGGLAVISPVVGLTASNGEYLASSLGIALGFAVVCWLSLVGHYNRGKRQWATLQEWNRQLRFELTDTGFRLRTERTSNELEWSLYGSWIEAEDAFYVQSGASIHVMPKRAFASEQEIDLVRELLGTHIRPTAENTVARPQSAGKTLALWLLLIALIALAYYINR